MPDKRVRFGEQENIRQRLQSHLVRDVRFFRVQLRPALDEPGRFVNRTVHVDVHKLEFVRRRRILYFSQQFVIVRRQEDSIDAVFLRQRPDVRQIRVLERSTPILPTGRVTRVASSHVYAYYWMFKPYAFFHSL